MTTPAEREYAGREGVQVVAPSRAAGKPAPAYVRLFGAALDIPTILAGVACRELNIPTAAAAQALGCSERTLFRRLREYDFTMADRQEPQAVEGQEEE